MSEPGASTCVVRAPETPAAPTTRADAAGSSPRAPASSLLRPAAARGFSQPEGARDLAESVAAFLASAENDGKGRRDGGKRASSSDVNHAEEDAAVPTESPARLGAGDEPVNYEQERVVDLFGESADRASVRAQLLGFYAATNQLAPAEPAGKGRADDTDASLATVTEMTLRVDTELELLRRQCFAERNARWDFATPDMFVFAPVVEPTWAPQPANYKLALLAGGANAPNGKAAFSSHAASSAVAPPTLDGFPVSDYARDRPWPPKEFAVKPATKPKGRGGKRKATPAAVVAAAAQAPVSLYPRMCVDCHTQSTPLWRKRVVKKTVAVPVVRPTDQVSVMGAVAVGQLGATPLSTGVVPAENGAQALARTPSGPLGSQGAVTQQQEVEEQVDVCMQCYLKTERHDLFERKKAEKMRKEREQRDRAAALAAAEKKRIQQLKKQQKKQLKQQQDQLKKERAASTGAATVADAEPIDTAPPTGPVVDNTGEAPMVLKFTKDELEAALERNAAKKEKKRSHHEKKKKKKKKRKLEHFDDSDTDGLTPMPSPPQMARYEYADIAHPGPGEDPHLAAYEAPELSVPEQPVEDSDAGRIAPRSSRKRDGKSKSSGGSSSKKRRSVDSAAEPVAPVVDPPLPPQVTVPVTSSRPSRAKAATPTAAAATPTSKRKRARTKKESNRERELRALGQYCPVCNETYEEDDDSSFVCCDSCEMWIHAACDPSLTPCVSLFVIEVV